MFLNFLDHFDWMAVILYFTDGFEHRDITMGKARSYPEIYKGAETGRAKRNPEGRCNVYPVVKRSSDP